jgi:hypothetical protein
MQLDRKQSQQNPNSWSDDDANEEKKKLEKSDPREIEN